ncbi:hypothetical protein [Neobacillus sp. PS3-40]|uniref:hypothetical protein n=1 Tax=Neobacillus sp. PS3-40 TaxID=3070679 RepID=UPI0027E17815|nr:hypothetical protein [Neobacillus sp. PS3-40]WML44377.1 hypothetical protein RCG20_00195 [Neobacillus sp. PS3-40]
MNDLLSTKGRLKEDKYRLIGKLLWWFFAFAVLAITSTLIASLLPWDNIWGKIGYFLLGIIILYVWIRFVIIVIKMSILSFKIMKINIKLLKEKGKAS